MGKNKINQPKTQPKLAEQRKMRARQEQGFYSTQVHQAFASQNLLNWQNLSAKQKITLALAFLLACGLTLSTVYFLAPQLVAVWNDFLATPSKSNQSKPNRAKMFNTRLTTMPPIAQPRVKELRVVKDYLPRNLLKLTEQTLSGEFQKSAIAIAKRLSIETGWILEKITLVFKQGLTEPSPVEHGLYITGLTQESTSTAANSNLDAKLSSLNSVLAEKSATTKIYMTCAILHAMQRSELHQNVIQLVLASPDFKIIVTPASSEIKGQNYASKYICSENALIFVEPLSYQQPELINLILNQFIHVAMALAKTADPKVACNGYDPQLFQSEVAPFSNEDEASLLSTAIDKADQVMLAKTMHALPGLAVYQPIRYEWHEPKPNSQKLTAYIQEIASGKQIIYLGIKQQIFYPDSYKETQAELIWSGYLVPDLQDKARALWEDTYYRCHNLEREYKQMGQGFGRPKLTYYTRAHNALLAQDPGFLRDYYSELLSYTENQLTQALDKQADHLQAQRFRMSA